MSYDGWTYNWENGRQLKSLSNASTTLSFKYNSDGIRTEKTVNGVTTKYTVFGDKVSFETTGSDKIHYSYDASGNLFSMNLNGTEYYYVRNAQGDITGLIDNVGNLVVSYTYDTWGKLLSTTGSLASTIGVKNPYRYRGYRYDTESGLYYLQSRYYNPEWGRFVNADDAGILEVDQDSLIENNLFVYALNNPVNMIDNEGRMAGTLSYMLSFGGVNIWNPIGWIAIGIGVAVVGYYGGQSAARYIQGKKKPINLPSFKKMRVDINHITSGHTPGGNRNRDGKKDVFYGMTAEAIRRAIQEAYNTAERLKSQGDRVFIKGYSKTYKMFIEMWVNTATKVIETAWPK